MGPLPLPTAGQRAERLLTRTNSGISRKGNYETGVDAEA